MSLLLDTPDTSAQNAPSPGSRKGGALRMTIRSIIKAAETGRLESTWTTSPITADAYISRHRRTLVARSRQGCEDYDHLRKYIALYRDNVVGKSGFILNSTPYDPGDKVDRTAKTAIEWAYRKWSRKANYDLNGRLGRADAERLAAVTQAKDGEAIAVLHYGANAGPWGFAVEMVDPELLDDQYFDRLRNGNVVVHGIEFAYGSARPVAYHFFKSQDERFGYVKSQERQRVDAERVIHWFLPEIIGQKRGLPQTRTALWRLRMLTGFEDAALTNARVAAAKMGFFKGGDEDVDDVPMDATPGAFENIGDRELVEWNPQFPNNETEPFVRVGVRSISAGLGVSYHSLSNDLSSVNFSSIRQGTLDDRGSWEVIQSSMIEGWILPIFEAWLRYSLLAGKIALNSGKPLPAARLDKFLDCEFLGRRWPWIDPSAEATGAEKMISQKLRSRSEVIRDMTQRDPSDVLEEIAREDAEMKALGITPLVPAGAAPEGESKAASETKPSDGDGDERANKGGAQESDAITAKEAALNGAQVTSLVSLATSVATGSLPKATALAIATAAFPLISPERINEIFDSLDGFTPAVVEKNPAEGKKGGDE